MQTAEFCSVSGRVVCWQMLLRTCSLFTGVPYKNKGMSGKGKASKQGKKREKKPRAVFTRRQAAYPTCLLSVPKKTGITSAAVHVLRDATESYLCGLVTGAAHVARARNQVTVQKRDIEAACKMSVSHTV